jgi:hypothetical protein
MVQSLKRHEFWRQQYRLRRYMEHLNEDDLQKRANDIFINLTLLNEDAKISLPKLSSDTEKWIILWTHLLEEFVIRFGPYPAGFTNGFMKDVRIPDPRSPNAPKAAKAVKVTSLPQGDYLFKYSKAKYLKSLLSEKKLRISSAASYDDPSLNPAIRDEELEISINPLPSEIKAKAYNGKTGKYKSNIQPKNIVYTARAKTNYYVYCLSLSFTPRLFFDFDADACLVIQKPNDFQEMILSSFESKMLNWSGGGESVNYIDSLNCPMMDIDIFSSKHFRYSYQKEYRLIWLPPEPKQKLDYVWIDVPDINEYCYLINLEEM